MLSNKNILFYANDAGGGNILIPIIKKLEVKNKIFLYPTGPTKKLWENQSFLYSISKTNNLDSIDLIITGTSHFSNTERNIWLKCKQEKKLCIAILDSWINIEDRFKDTKNNGYIFPNEIYVLTNGCKKKILNLNPNLKVMIIENPLMNYFNKTKKNNYLKDKSIIYFCSSKNNLDLDTQFKIIEKIKNISLSKHKFLIKPHPSDTVNDWKKRFPTNLTNISNVLLFENSILSISSNSFSLIDSVLAGVPSLNIITNNSNYNFYKDYKKYIKSLNLETFLSLNSIDIFMKQPKKFSRKNKNNWEDCLKI